jgi:hypothetical protein
LGLALVKIISGGQTGADFGALTAARELGLQTGGVAPKGWLTETGPQEAVLRSFGLIECEEEGYPSRTRRNVRDSDGTLLVGEYQTGGTRLTYETALALNKPLFLLACTNPAETPLDTERAAEFGEWLQRHHIQVLNVAGNRESERPGIAAFTRAFLLGALRDRVA